jgi:hypothetical protein
LWGELDREALGAALCDVVERHESLRTIFPERDGIARQEIVSAQACRPQLLIREISETELAGALTQAAEEEFDLARELPLRAHLYVLSGGEHVLLLVLHHIAGDGWSLRPLLRDLAASYAGRRDGVAADLPALAVQYADYTLWQREVLGQESDAQSAIARQLEYWGDRLRGVAEEIELPSDRRRPAVASYRGDRVGVCVRRSCMAGSLSLGGGMGRACSWLCRRGLRRC